MPPPNLPYDHYAHHGRLLVETSISERYPDGQFPPLALPPPPSADDISASTPGKVGILGAGAAGLYTALILQDLGIPYEILEATKEFGGRLFTYKFKDSTGSPYNYYDVGAMRFPEIDSMARLWHLFDYLPALASKKIPYRFTATPDIHDRSQSRNNAFFYYNGVRVRQNQVPTGDPFMAEYVIKDTKDPKPYIAAGVHNITKDVIGPFAEKLLDDLKDGSRNGWDYMMEFDKYSTRAFMSTKYEPKIAIPKGPLTNDIVNWCETFDKSTGWYDRALSETVLEAIAFGWQPGPDPSPTEQPKVKWWCLDGGAVQIAACMNDYIKAKNPQFVKYEQRVTSITAKNGVNGGSVLVRVNGTDTTEYAHVVSTIPLPVLRMVDLTHAGLSPMQSNALRGLNYGPSIKVGMQFQTAWWTTGVDLDGKPLNIVGGQSFTDLPVRTVVYPSFGDVEHGKTTTLIASYCWTEDAYRLGALMDHDDEAVTQRLQDGVLADLAAIHNVSADYLKSQLIEMMPWNWVHDDNTMGAFAFFGPGKFNNTYLSLTYPAADKNLHFAGEAISTRHAWVEGALDSAWRAVKEIIETDPLQYHQFREKFYKNWGTNPEWITGTGVFGEGHAPLPENDLLLQHMVSMKPELFSFQ